MAGWLDGPEAGWPDGRMARMAGWPWSDDWISNCKVGRVAPVPAASLGLYVRFCRAFAAGFPDLFGRFLQVSVEFLLGFRGKRPHIKKAKRKPIKRTSPHNHLQRRRSEGFSRFTWQYNCLEPDFRYYNFRYLNQRDPVAEVRQDVTGHVNCSLQWTR